MHHFQNSSTANRMTAILTTNIKDSEVAHKILPRRNLAMTVSEVKQVYKPENKQISYTTQLSRIPPTLPPTPPSPQNYYSEYAGYLGDKNVVVCRNFMTLFRLNIILESNEMIW